MNFVKGNGGNWTKFTRKKTWEYDWISKKEIEKQEEKNSKNLKKQEIKFNLKKNMERKMEQNGFNWKQTQTLTKKKILKMCEIWFPI